MGKFHVGSASGETLFRDSSYRLFVVHELKHWLQARVLEARGYGEKTWPAADEDFYRDEIQSNRIGVELLRARLLPEPGLSENNFEPEPNSKHPPTFAVVLVVGFPTRMHDLWRETTWVWGDRVNLASG